MPGGVINEKNLSGKVFINRTTSALASICLSALQAEISNRRGVNSTGRAPARLQFSFVFSPSGYCVVKYRYFAQ